ncbi:ARMT1-like domain-containing protein [bacterium]|nr:ARMT1-like domain-containing protein [bacterium]
MKVQIDCVPCQVKQCLATARKLTDDEKLISKTLKEGLNIAAAFETHENVFSLYYAMQQNVKKINPDSDPYKEFKKKFNEICLNIAPDLSKIAYDSKDIFETALIISLAGNAIDVMQGNVLNEKYLKQSVKNSFNQSLRKDNISLLKENIINARKILFIGDNAGEIVFDRIFIEILKDKILKSSDSDKITYSVRGGPTLNDSTLTDALMIGMDKVVKVVTTGIDLPAAYLPLCSKEFNEEYNSSDLVISKGQGNFEALFSERKNIFFLLKLKCETFLKFFDGRYELGEVVVEHAKI